MNALWTFLRRVRIAVAMTLEYGGRFPRRKVWPFYWREAGRMVKPETPGNFDG